MKRAIAFGSLLGFVAISVFMITEIAISAAASVWALSGLFGLGHLATQALAVAVAAPSLYGIVKIVQLAYQAQINPENG
jgi:hypothetical protein